MADTRRFVLLAVGAGVAAALAAIAERRASTPAPPTLPRAGVTASPAASAECPAGSLPDHGVCIPVPAPGITASRATAVSTTLAIARRPDRPAAPERYLWPVASLQSVEWATLQRPGSPALRPEPLPGALVRAPAGTTVRVPELTGQRGPATVFYAGELLGPTLVTRHSLAEGGTVRDVLLVLANLREVPPLAPGAPAPALAGVIGDALTPGTPALYVDARRIRGSRELSAARPDELLSTTHTLAVDVRNVLQLAPNPAAR